MDPIIFLTLSIASFLTAAISGLLGMAGGVTLLSIMSFFLPMQTLVPIHGVVQLVSNSSRAWFLRTHVVKALFLWFLLGLPLGTILAVKVVKQLNNHQWPLLLIGLLILYTVFKPKKLPAIHLPMPAFALVGFAVGFLGPLVGATGPFIANFFLRDDLSKENIVATKAMVQLLGHLAKLPAFLYLGFHYQEYGMIILSLSAMAILGTRFGVSWLKQLSDKHFRLLFKSVLFLAALRILYKVFLEDQY